MMLSPGWGGHRFASCTISIRSGDLSARRTAEEPYAGKSTCTVPRGAGRREHPAYSTWGEAPGTVETKRRKGL